MRNVRSFHRLQDSINKILLKSKSTHQELEYCLTLIKNYVENIIQNHFLNGLLIDIPGLDDLCQLIGKRLTINEQAPILSGNGCIMYVVSQLYTSGGHSANVEDFIKAQPNRSHIILFTDIDNYGVNKSIKERFQQLPVKLLVPPKNKQLITKFQWLQEQWRLINPNKVFLFNHHHDVVAIAAAQPAMPGDLYYYHHADYLFALGKRLKHAKHLDIQPLTYSYCRHTVGLDNLYSPLTCEDIDSHSQIPLRFEKSKPIHTASSGGAAKFLQPYSFQYIDLLPEIMKTTQGTHTHIGYLPYLYLRKLKKNLAANSISLDRFHYIPWVKDVGKTLQERGIDLLLTSFPVGGGRTAIEAMASGTPILCHLNYRSIFLSENNLLYPDAWTWNSKEELIEILKNKITSESLQLHAKMARDHYVQNYHHSLLEKAIMNDFSEVPSLYSVLKINKQILNETQLFLDLNQEWVIEKKYLKKSLRFIWQLFKPKK